jgi:hypothetical protein
VRLSFCGCTADVAAEAVRRLGRALEQLPSLPPAEPTGGGTQVVV